MKFKIQDSSIWSLVSREKGRPSAFLLPPLYPDGWVLGRPGLGQPQITQTAHAADSAQSSVVLEDWLEEGSVLSSAHSQLHGQTCACGSAGSTCQLAPDQFPCHITHLWISSRMSSPTPSWATKARVEVENKLMWAAHLGHMLQM